MITFANTVAAANAVSVSCFVAVGVQCIDGLDAFGNLGGDRQGDHGPDRLTHHHASPRSRLFRKSIPRRRKGSLYFCVVSTEQNPWPGMSTAYTVNFSARSGTSERKYSICVRSYGEGPKTALPPIFDVRG
jgi:hypothetical protein